MRAGPSLPELMAAATASAGWVSHPALRLSEAEGLAGHSNWLVFERHLGEPTRPCDLILLVEGEAGRAALRPPPGSALAAIAQAWRDPASPLHSVKTLTVELDSGSTLPPMVFVSLHPAVTTPGHRSDVDRVSAALFAAAGTEVPGSVAGVLDALSSGSWPTHIGPLSPRGVEGARLVVTVRRDSLGALLTEAGWPGDPAQAQALADTLGRYTGYVDVHLDCAGRLGPQLGLEVFYPEASRRGGRWDPILERLDSQDPVFARTFEEGAGWFATTGPWLRMVGAKLVLAGAAPLRAKAYYGIRANPSSPR